MRRGQPETTLCEEGGATGDLGLSTREEDLLTLLLDKQLYGLEILKGMKANRRAIGVGSLYPMLHGMEKKRLVESWWGEDSRAARGHARRRYYTATGLGKRVLAQTRQRRAGLEQWRSTSTGASRCPRDHGRAP
jgi:PadR family transcriptional regulator PadR